MLLLIATEEDAWLQACIATLVLMTIKDSEEEKWPCVLADGDLVS